jgi:hypothetical protein
MSIAQSTLCGIVSVGGESVRLKKFVRDRDGTDIPRQFSALTGSAPTPLHRTFLTEA